MLTRELAIAVYKGNLAFPDRLTVKTHRQYLAYAEQMCELYAFGKGKQRRDLHREVRKLFESEPDCPPRRIDAFCKLLDEASVYSRDEDGAAAKLRRQVFRAAAVLHPLVNEADPWFEHEEKKAKQQIAESLGRTWTEIDTQLFADIIEHHRLETFNGFESPGQLLARYNVAQTQVALFDATRMTVWATRDYKTILRYAKLARLMHNIQRNDNGNSYRFDFSGPASLLHHTHRYGVSMARFLPGLLACAGWRMKAELKPSRWRGRLLLELDANSGLKSQAAAPEEFDSSIEENFYKRWGDQPREGWQLSRESSLLHHGQTVFTPDFVLKHDSGRVVYLEIVGFWTPEYLAAKQATLKKFTDHRILLAVAQQVKFEFETTDANLFFYKTAITIDAVLQQLKLCQ